MTRNGGSELKRSILDEARKVLLGHGYTSLSMRRIAGAVGCTATSIYLYFQNKDALIHSLIDEGFDMLDDALESATEGIQEPVERLEALCRAFLEFGLANPEFYEIMFMLHPKHMERYPREKYRKARRSLELFGENLAESSRRTGVPVKDLRVAANATWCSLHGTVSLLIAQRVDVGLDREALIREVVTLASRIFADRGRTRAATIP